MVTELRRDPGQGLENERGRLRVVLADDTDDLRYLVRIVLQQDGFDVVGEAADGATAIDSVIEHQPDVLLLDLAMPVMDGMTAIPLIREASPKTTIVILSAFNGNVGRQAIERGAHAVLSKAESIKDLPGLIRDAITRNTPHLSSTRAR